MDILQGSVNDIVARIEDRFEVALLECAKSLHFGKEKDGIEREVKDGGGGKRVLGE